MNPDGNADPTNPGPTNPEPTSPAGSNAGPANHHQTPVAQTPVAQPSDAAARLADRLAIGDLMTGWIHRDLGEWDALRDLFTTDATIEITWFRGLARDFVDGSSRMGAGRLRTKHLITTPVITFSDTHPERAFVETNAAIIAEHGELLLGTTTHNRFLDRVVKDADGQWRIAHRDSSYDIGAFTYPLGVEAAAPIDREKLSRFPIEYASLAYLLEAAGFPVTGTFPTRGSQLESDIRASGLTWLSA